MPQGLQALIALLVLLPGFVSAGIVRIMSARGKQSEFERVIEAFVFSFLTYVIYIFLFGINLPIEWVSTFDKAGMQHYSVNIYRFKLTCVVAIALFLGFVWSYIKNKDLLLKRFRRWGLTDRTSRETVWNDVFANLGGTVQVGLADGREIIGWIARYSDTDGERSLFLANAAWVAADGNLVNVPGSGILLTDKSEIKFVMFLDKQEK